MLHAQDSAAGAAEDSIEENQEPHEPSSLDEAKHQKHRRLPGSSASFPIPPTDSPEYKRLQKAFKTEKALGELTEADIPED